MAAKRGGRGRPRKSSRSATGFATTRKKKFSPTKEKSPGSSTTEGPSAFEALCQVTSAEYERLSSSRVHAQQCDNQSDASSKSTEENRLVYSTPLSSPSDVALPAWYGAAQVAPKPFKNELILPPKKKKYLHYLIEADDENQIINDPFQPQTTEVSRPWTSSLGGGQTPFSSSSTSATVNAAAVLSTTASAVVPELSHPSTSHSPEQLAPLRFNPTPSAPTVTPGPDGKTFSDVLDEHISRLITQNDVIMAKQPAVAMSKRGRSRDSATEVETAPRPQAAHPHNESMVKTLLSSKLTRKSMLAAATKESQSVRPQPSFSYLNPEKSAIKDLLIKTYEDKGMVGSAVAVSGAQVTEGYTAKDTHDFRSQRYFTSPSDAMTGKTCLSSGIVYQISSDHHTGALVMPDSRVADMNNYNSAGWIVSPNNEWVSIDERGRKRVRPEVTVYPETASYQGIAPSPARSLRSPSIDSAISSESCPSSAGMCDSRRVIQTSGTFQPFRNIGDLLETKMPPPPNSYAQLSTVRTAGTFLPGSNGTVKKPKGVDEVENVSSESHEKTLSALRGHLTGRRFAEDLDVTQVAPVTENSMLPPKKRKGAFQLLPVVPSETADNENTAPLIEPISPPPEDEPPQSTSARSLQSSSQESAFSGYANYVNGTHPSHLNFYSDLSRQYSTNVAFAQTLLQQGHYYPSFRYSCVTTSSTRAGRPMHVPNGEQVSMYANWSPMPSIVNPNIHVDSSIYGKKKSEGLYYSSAVRKSATVGATSVETYTRKRQLILNGMNSFLPSEASKLCMPEVSVMNRDPYGEIGSKVNANEPSTSTSARSRVQYGGEGKNEHASEEESMEESLCSDCGKRFAKPKQRWPDKESKYTCAHCLTTGRSRCETMPKQSRPSASRRFSEATKRLSETNGHHAPTPSAGPIEKPLITQLKQKIAEHQQHHSEVPYEGSYTQQKPTVDRSDHDIMDLSVRKAPIVEGTSDWLRSVDGASNRFPCLHCGKIFSRESQLYLHSRVHEMETPTKSDKKKAKADRAVSPSGSSGNMAATSDNPRPFFCAECNVGFRIHGHLQKHLRSKGHITQLECLNRLPCGFYAELERQNMITKLHTMIDTADCSKAFTCLSQLAKTVNVGVQVAAPQSPPSAPAAPAVMTPSPQINGA
ncbi:hypothetical protein RvY_13756 [Ramazzottius varieornatus]|uniref:C2H2-type domain-containing protein n=1 Tax=Ramazzottius varieornatus TaxID=947166 RepID=A0A1D1VWF2_RAMVA|nr:hypothetical protein RvY_13756 [Ramazzottius varieornatus]